MKRLLCICLSILIFTASINVCAVTASPTVSIVCVDSVNSEDTFDVYVSVTENSGIGGGNLTIGYNNDVLEIVSANKELLLGNARAEINTAYTSSSLRMSWSGTTNLTAGGNLFKITFKAKIIYDDVTTSISIRSMKLTDADTNVISGICVADTLQVKGKMIPTFSVECDDELDAENFDVCININKDSFACGGKFTLVYDNNKFQVVETQFGEIMNDISPEINTACAGEIRMSWAGTTPITDEGCLLKVTFKVLDTASGYSDFALTNCKMADNNDIVIQCRAKDKTIRIKCFTETEFCEEDGLWKFTTTIRGCPESAVLFVALYKSSGQMVAVERALLSGESSKDVYIDKCDFDKARIFVWESFLTLRTMSDGEEIPYE